MYYINYEKAYLGDGIYKAAVRMLQKCVYYSDRNV